MPGFFPVLVPFAAALCAAGTVTASAGADEPQLLHTLEGHTDCVLAVAFHPNGTRLASSGSDKTVIVWDATTGKKEHILRGHNSFLHGLTFCPDGRHLAASGDDGVITIWDVEKGMKVRSLGPHGDAVWSIAYSPDGRWLASGSFDRTVQVWDAATGKVRLTLRGHTEKVLGVAFSPDGRRLASASMDGTTVLWELATGQECLRLRGAGDGACYASVAFRTDGKGMASVMNDRGAGDERRASVSVWEPGSGRERWRLQGAEGRLTNAVYGPEDGFVLAGSMMYKRDRWQGEVRAWDLATGKQRWAYRDLPGVFGLGSVEQSVF